MNEEHDDVDAVEIATDCRDMTRMFRVRATKGTSDIVGISTSKGVPRIGESWIGPKGKSRNCISVVATTQYSPGATYDEWIVTVGYVTGDLNDDEAKNGDHRVK